MMNQCSSSFPTLRGLHHFFCRQMTAAVAFMFAVTASSAGCQSRRFAHSEQGSIAQGQNGTRGIQQVSETWADATVIKVPAADTYVLSVSGSPGSRTVSLFGLRPAHLLTPEVARQRALDRLMPGNKVSVDIVSRSDSGRLFARIRDAQGDVGTWLVERGVASPFVVCRAVDRCTPSALRDLGVEDIAAACSRTRSSWHSAQQDHLEEILSREQIRWVGDLRDRTIVPVDSRQEVPFCARIYFGDGFGDPNGGLEQFGFHRRPSPPPSARSQRVRQSK